MKLNRKLARLKAERGLTTEALSQRSGVPKGTLNKILNGETRNPTISTLAALADALTQDKPVLYDIKVLPGTMTPGYDSWWRVGVAEVSTQPRVQAAYDDLADHVKNTRKF